MLTRFKFISLFVFVWFLFVTESNDTPNVTLHTASCHCDTNTSIILWFARHRLIFDTTHLTCKQNRDTFNGPSTLLTSFSHETINRPLNVNDENFSEDMMFHSVVEYSIIIIIKTLLWLDKLSQKICLVRELKKNPLQGSNYENGYKHFIIVYSHLWEVCYIIHFNLLSLLKTEIDIAILYANLSKTLELRKT